MEKNKTLYIASIVLVLIMIFGLFKACNKPTNTIITDINQVKDPIVRERILRDSTRYLEVQAKLADSKKLLSKLQDSLQSAMSKNSNLTPEVLIKYKETISYRDISGNYVDTIDYLVNNIISQQKKIDSLNIGKIDPESIISVPKEFSFKDKWIKGSGTVKKKSVNIDSLVVTSEPTIVFGEKYSRKLFGIHVGSPTITALIGNKNPYAKQSDLSVYDYKPKSKKIGAVLGATYMFDGKQMKLGVGVTVGFKLF